jgi:hypothetical protein
MHQLNELDDNQYEVVLWKPESSDSLMEEVWYDYTRSNIKPT